MKKEVDVGQLVTAFLTVNSSKPVRDAIFKCLSRCLYNGEKIVMKTFEPESARQDYYEVAIACVQVNCRPFAESLISILKDRLATILPKRNSQKSE